MDMKIDSFIDFEGTIDFYQNKLKQRLIFLKVFHHAY